MTPIQETLVAWRNARFAEEWPFKKEDDTPIDLTGYRGAMHVRDFAGAPGAPRIAADTVLSDVQGVWIREPAAGIVQVRIDEAALAAAYDAVAGDGIAGTARHFEYDLRLTAADGTQEVWLAGEFIIQAGVTL